VSAALIVCAFALLAFVVVALYLLVEMQRALAIIEDELYDDMTTLDDESAEHLKRIELIELELSLLLTDDAA
jgi:hypothetical protein